ncbi:MAG TPA: hypothetical protein VM869_15580 [Enhygromyxa sp.]|nr:hypothetical protein [Enhygromyxa sp.]
MLERVTSDGFSLGPVTFTREQVATPRGQVDVLVAHLDRTKLERRFVFEYQVAWTRKSCMEAVERLRRAGGRKLLPMLLTPYLSPELLDELVAERISAIDACGNGLLADPPALFILRTGAKKPKQHKQPSSPTRLAIYESSNVATLVPRIFLSQRVFPTTTAVLDACHARMMTLGAAPTPLTLSTVSKALRQLDEDLVTDRRGRERHLRDPERLLQHLQRGFRLPSTPPLLLKSKLTVAKMWTQLQASRPQLRFVATGRQSAIRHIGLAGPDRLQLYVSDASLAQQALEAKPTQAFPNLELIETGDEAPYFDSREHDRGVWSSPLQCYLELARIQADPRERDVAEKLRAKLIDAVRTQPVGKPP